MIEVYIVYPEERWVNEARIRMWYADAVDNDECEGGHTELEFMMRELDDIGHVTFTTKIRGGLLPGLPVDTNE